MLPEDEKDQATKSKKYVIHKVTIFIVLVLFGVGCYYLGLMQSNTVSQTFTREVSVSPLNPTRLTENETICGIEKNRFSEPIYYGDQEYLIYKRNSMNVYMHTKTNYLESGVLVMDKNNPDNCNKIIEITDLMPAKNNIYEVLVEKNNLYLLVVDQFGAGSGEGNAKILKSADNAKTWKLDYCFYYTPEKWVSLKNFVKDKQNLINPDKPECTNFTLSSDF